MNRVVVFGTAGSGKTTLARRLSERTGLPLVERDALGVLGSGDYRFTRPAAARRWLRGLG